MCRASCKKTYKFVTRQQRMGEQSRLSTWPDVNVLTAWILSQTYTAEDSDLSEKSIFMVACSAG
jgi:hypothetical protein